MINKENIAKDSIYSELYNKHGENYVINAGYFENDNQNNCFTDEELIESLKFLSTPLPKIEELQDNSIILLNTGCYNPIHQHHILMMDIAKHEMEQKGFHVAKGYFTPDADTYVKTKSELYYNINQRCELINKTLESFYWLTVDPWSATYVDTDVNFSTIYRRLELYIEKYLGRKVPIYYVCGSDRGNFSYTFEDKTIVIERSKIVEVEPNNMVVNVIKNDIHPNANYFSYNVPLSDSSSQQRESWSLETFPKLEKKKLILRIDTKNSFFGDILNDFYSEVNFNNISVQERIFNSLDKNTISLDSLLIDRFHLEISRFYNLGGYDFVQYNNRIGSDSLIEQIDRIPKGVSLYLFDDDIYTGGTLRFARKLLKDHDILGEITLVKTNIEQYEVLDLRDFILGDINNGLAIKAPNGDTFRVPYIYPFVDPYARASVIEPIKFSEHIWNVNYTLFNISYPKITVGSSKAFDCFKYIGFDDNTLIVDICKYFRDNLVVKK